MRVPKQMRTLFWNVDFETLDAAKHADFILERVLERGRLADVRWVVVHYGVDRLRRFFRESARPALDRRTLRFWRVALNEEKEPWPDPSVSRRNISAPWIA